jgi:hypothetical protein
MSMSSFASDFGSAFMTPAEFGPIGTTKGAIVTGVAQQALGPEKTLKWVIHLTGNDGTAWKPWPLNRTSGRNLVEGFGKDERTYAGKRVEMRCEQNPFGAGAALFVYPLANGQADTGPATPAQPDLDDDIPF